MKIAIVDDDLSVRRGLARLLRSASHEVEAFDSGERFLASLPRGTADWVVLDVHLGGMDGFAVRRALAESGSTARVLFMTAHDELHTREQLRAAGGVPCLRKPFDGRTLLDAIETAAAEGQPEPAAQPRRADRRPAQGGMRR